MQSKRSNITRRSALRLFALAGSAMLTPAYARADTQSDLASAQSRLAEAQAQLDAIAVEYETLSTEQSLTLDELEAVRNKIKRVTQRISKLEKRLFAKQRELATNVAEEYKDGNHGVVDIFLGAATIDDLISNLYYYDKVIEEKTNLIQDVKDTKGDLTAEQAELEAQQANLEVVSQTQQEQLEAMRDKQYEAQVLIDSLDEEVRALIAKRDAEILAAQQEAERARKQREEAARKEQEQSSSAAATATNSTISASTGSNATVENEGGSTNTAAGGTTAGADGQQDGSATGDASNPEATASDDSAGGEKSDDAQYADDWSDATDDGSTYTGATQAGSAAAVVAACMSTPSPGAGLCAGWCSDVMINAGYGFVSGNANDMYSAYCFSSNRSELMPGMAVAVSSHPHTTAGRIYGHIGMYIGGGMMMDNVGYIRTISVDEWCKYYGETVPPRWGWLNGIVLT